MIKLINRGRYDKPVQDEFEHLTSRIATFLSQIFDEDGNLIQSQGGQTVAAVATGGVRQIAYGNVSINSGATVGYSVPPLTEAHPLTCLLFNNGTASSSLFVSLRWDDTLVPGSWVVRAERSTTTGNQIVEYMVVKVRLVE